MKKLVAVILLISFTLCGCGKTEPPADQVEPNIFHADRTAIAFLEGYWTDGRGNYLSAARGEGPLIVWETNLPVAQCQVYVLRDGILKGGQTQEDGSARELDLLRFEKLDENSIRVENLGSGQESTFIRDSLEVDPQRLDNGYVFWSMRRAASFLAGMWMDENGDYFTLVLNENGNVTWNSNLNLPDCEAIDFCDGALCTVTRDAEGNRCLSPAYTFDITSEDSMEALCHATGLSSHFERLSRELDTGLLESRYLFSTPQRAFVFLEGLWKDGKGNFFSVEDKNGNLRWNTNLSLPRYESYSFANGGMVGIRTAEDNSQVAEIIYTFTVLSQDEVEIRVPDSDKVYAMSRQK